jgi:hypothetical protein
MHGFDATGFQKVLCEVSEKLGCDLVPDPHVLLLEVDDELFRFMFGWQSVDRALQAIVPGIFAKVLLPLCLTYQRWQMWFVTPPSQMVTMW